MRCPFCNTGAHETLDQCKQCGLTLAEVQRVFGVAATLEPGVTDLEQIMSKKEQKGVAKELDHFHRKFPQGKFSVVTNANPMPKLPLSVYGFWLFNTSGISRKIDKAGENHDLLLVIDTKRGAAALLIGYGLEPFLSAQHVTAILEAGQVKLRVGKWAEAIREILAATETHLAEICSGLNRTFGIDIQKIYEADKERKGELVRQGEF